MDSLGVGRWRVRGKVAVLPATLCLLIKLLCYLHNSLPPFAGGSLSIASMLTRCSQNVLKGSFRRSSFARPVLCDKFLSRAFFHSLIVGPSTSSRSIEHPLRSPKVVTSNRHLATSSIAVENEEIDNSFVEENGEKWRMVSGVIVERTPRLTHVDPAWVKKRC